MARGVELATAYVTLTAETSEISKSIGKAFSNADRAAASTGTSMGRALKSAFNKEKPVDTEKLTKELENAERRHTAAVERGAREREAAARKVEVAEARVQEVREKSIRQSAAVRDAEKALERARESGDADKIAAAEKRLADARDNVKPTSADLAAEDRLIRARQNQERVNLETASSVDKLEKELKDAKKAVNDAGAATNPVAAKFKSMGERIKAATQGNFGKAFARVKKDGSDAANDLERGFKKAGEDSGSGFSAGFKKLAFAAGGLFAVDKVKDFGVESFMSAADLEQSTGAVETVFKQHSSKMLKYAQDADQALGMSENSYNELATILGTQLRNAGMKDFAEQTNDLIGLGADFSAMFGGTATEAVEAISSALKGERDPIEKYGISLRQSAIDAKAAELGYKKVGGSYDQQAQAAATLALINDQSKDAQGAFNRELHTASNVIQRAKAWYEDFAASIGEKLLPAFTAVGSWILDNGIPFFDELGWAAQNLWGILFEGDFKGSFFGIEEDSEVIGFLFDLRDAAIEVGQKVVGAFSAIDFSRVWESVKAFGGKALGALGSVFTGLAPMVFGIFSNVGPAIGEAASNVIPVVLDFAGTVVDTFVSLWEKVGPFLQAAIDGLTPIIKGAIDSIAPVLATVADILGPVISWLGEALGAVVEWLTPLAPVIAVVAGVFVTLGAVIGPVIGFISTLVGWVSSAIGAITSVASVIGGLITAVTALIGPIGWIVIGVGAAAAALWAFFTKTETGRGIVEAAWNGIKGAIGAVVDWVVNTAWPMLQAVWDGIAAGAQWLWKSVIEPVWTGIKFAIALAVAVIMTEIDAWVWVFKNVVAPVFEWLWHSVIEPVWAGIKGAIGAVVSWFQNTAWPVISVVINALKTAFTWLWQSVIIPVWNGIKSAIQAVVSWFQNTAWPMVSRVISQLQNAFNWLWRNVIIPVWSGIKSAISAVVQWFQGTAWPIISRVIGSIKNAFNVMKSAVGAAWNGVKSVVRPVADWFSSTVWPKISGVTDNIKKAFNTMKDAVGKAWNGIEEAAKKPINFVIDTVYNKGIKGNFDKIAGTFGLKKLPSFAGFARGGILPGFSRMRDGDDQLVPMRRGEGVLVSEALRTARDKAAFLAVNSAGRRGQGFADTIGFAGGGILDKAGSIAGDVLDGGKKLLKGAWDFVSDPVGAFKGLVGGLIGKIPGAGFFKDLALGVGRKILDGVVNKVQSVFSPAGNPDAAPVSVPPGASRSLGYAQAVARRFGLTMTSFRRGGARTAGSGSVSLHALGRAMDFSNSSGPTPQMMAFFNAMHPLRPTELLYSPAGSRQWRRSGRMADTSGVTKRMHYNHVHVGFAQGGIIPASIVGGFKPYLHDNGGWHMPGKLSINQTQKPEAVLTARQWETVERSLNHATSSGMTINVTPPPVDDPGTWAQRIGDTLNLRGALLSI
ncbi:hypothetical protein HMPREF1484_00253 [Dermabacter sp. HFH0086]|uniref:hypothetical protein n=1 Tax=Dermabacter TaxID=36739 RepID=UPI000353EA42|nr:MULTISPECIES: hypothetical protein [Dermabacter]EPH17568.1 hypothetical protein HMPREF1484_00253 [Dermabacter sp. HFH0086]